MERKICCEVYEMKYGVFEYLGDYPIDHQPLWSKRFATLQEAVEEAIQLYLRRLTNDWEPEIEAKPEITLSSKDNYYIAIQQSTPNDDNDFYDEPMWMIGLIENLLTVEDYIEKA
jgi:hypothetical protein